MKIYNTGWKNLLEVTAEVGGAVEVAVRLMCAPVVLVEYVGAGLEVGDGAGDSKGCGRSPSRSCSCAP